MFTRRGSEGLHPNAKLTAGSKRYGQLAGGLAFGSGAFDGAVQLQHTENRGFSATNAKAQFGNHHPDDDGFNQNAGSLRLGWQATRDWRVDALALESTGKTQYDDGPTVDSRAKLFNRILSLQASGRIGEAWRSKLSAATFDR